MKLNLLEITLHVARIIVFDWPSRVVNLLLKLLTNFQTISRTRKKIKLNTFPTLL